MGAAAVIGAVAVAGVAGAAISANAQSGAASTAANAQEQAASQGSAAQVQAAQIAANAQTQATQLATQTQQNMYNQTRADLQPFVQSGVTNLNALNAQMPSLTQKYGLQAYYNSPEYAVQTAAAKQQANNLNAQAAAGGQYGGGNIASALTANAQNNALQGYTTGLSDYNATNLQNYNMRNNLAAAGQNAAVGLGGIGANTASGIANAQIASGNAQAQSAYNTGNALATGYSTIGNAAAQNAIAQGQATSGLAGSVAGAITGGLGAYNQNQIYQNYLSQAGLGSSLSSGLASSNNYGIGQIGYTPSTYSDVNFTGDYGTSSNFLSSF